MKDTMAAYGRAVPVAPGLCSPVLLGFTDADLKVCDIMMGDVICAAPGETVLSAVRRMSECRVSCVLVVEGDTVAGILTERDVLRSVAAGGRDPTKVKVAEKMSSPVVSVEPDVPVLEAGAIMGFKGIKRLAVLDGGQLLGLVTQTDITRGLVSLWPYKEVADIMSTEVVTADASATVAEAARLMSSRNISCVVVLRQQDAVGMMTEKDVLKRVVALHRDPDTTLVADVMSHPIVALAPTQSILFASRMMDRVRIHRLVVKENKQVYGIVSQTDILEAVRRELEQIRAAQHRREAEVIQLTESTAQNLAALEDLLREPSALCEPPGAPSARTALQDLIAESKDNLERISCIVQRCGVFEGGFDSPHWPTRIPPRRTSGVGLQTQ
jgi:CBS domain-containing protein